MKQDVSNLRDARLKKALAHAPDALDEPSQAIRKTIRTTASDAIATKGSARLDANPSWWKRFWASTGRASSPWNAAFATVLLGSIITLVWYGQEVPDAAVDERLVASPKVQGNAPPAATAPLPPTVQTPPATATVPAPSVEPAQPPLAKSIPSPKPSKSPLSSPKASDKTKTEPLEGRRKEDASTSGSTESRMEQVAPSATVRAPAPMPPAPAPAIAAAAPPPAAPVPAPPQGLGRAGVLADQARSGAKVAAEASSSAAVMLLQWNSMDMVYRGRTAKLSKAESQSLTAQVQALVASAVDSAALLPSTKPTLQLKWYSENATGATEVATFSLWGGRFAWQVGGSPSVEGVALSEQLETLLASVNRVLPP
jgi:hypothetical protein